MTRDPMAMGDTKGMALPAEQDRAVVPSGSSPQAVSPVPASIPSAAWDAMAFYVATAKAEGKYTRLELWLSPDLYRALSLFGERPTELHGVALAEREEWSWGWLLMVGNSICPLRPFEPAQAIEARQGGNGEAGAVHESAVPTGEAP